MAGVTDRPFRVLCRHFGAALAATEMLTADSRLWSTPKSRHRMNHEGEPEPRVVQLAGADPQALAAAARANVALGAQIIDLNMGCPAKKVCGRSCGSALLADETLVASILETVVRAVEVPVTLKIRTGWDPEHRNGVKIACIAEQCGIAALAVHGRTRADFFAGSAEYLTIRDIKSRVAIPVFANGDIDTPQKARAVLDFTGADGVMIGRASHGSPMDLSRCQRPCCAMELKCRHFSAASCVISFSRISTPCTSSMARRPESGSRANISAGIASSCWTARRRSAGI